MTIAAMATLEALRAAVLPGARWLAGTDRSCRAVAAPERRELAWVRLMRARVPAFDALETGDLGDRAARRARGRRGRRRGGRGAGPRRRRGSDRRASITVADPLGTDTGQDDRAA